MNDILDALTTRQSIRRYRDEPIPDEIFNKALEAARWAPSGENEHPWKIIVVKDYFFTQSQGNKTEKKEL